MKPILGWALAMASAVLVAMPAAVSAQHINVGWRGDIGVFEAHDAYRWRSGGWHHGWHGGRSGWWWVSGGAWYSYPQPVYPYPDPYRPPVVVVEQEPVYVQIPAPAPAPVQIVTSPPPVAARPAPQFWYYCDAARGYYPYVSSCPGGWKTVPATPSGVPQ